MDRRYFLRGASLGAMGFLLPARTLWTPNVGLAKLTPLFGLSKIKFFVKAFEASDEVLKKYEMLCATNHGLLEPVPVTRIERSTQTDMKLTSYEIELTKSLTIQGVFLINEKEECVFASISHLIVQPKDRMYHQYRLCASI